MKFSQWPINTTPVPTDNILSVQNPGSTPQDVQVPISDIVNTGVTTIPYKANYYRNAVLSQTPGIVKMDEKIYDTDSNYSTSTGLFTAPAAGFYQVSVTISVQTASGFNFWASIYKNSAEYVEGNRQYASANSTAGLTVTDEVQLALGDTIGAYYNSSYTGAATINNGSGPILTKLSISYASAA